MIHTFSGNNLDRGDAIRRDQQLVDAAASHPDSLFLGFYNLDVLVHDDDGVRLGWLSQRDISGLSITIPPILLGMRDGITYFAIDLSMVEDSLIKLNLGSNWTYRDCRAVAMALQNNDTGIIAQARAQISWHSNHQFCSKCGNTTQQRKGGHVRRCESCKADHFPRTDPVVIMLIANGEQCLLGQGFGPMVKMNMYSTLAGFIDQGESIEEAVRREVKEEAGIEVGDVHYHSSQPWPFPSSLMIGCQGQAISTDITIDPVEMADVRWFSKAEVADSLYKRTKDLYLPGSMAIAHHLIRSWIENKH
ncbi:MAG: NAD(+) diphosphatase [Oceanicoccus sp.]